MRLAPGCSPLSTMWLEFILGGFILLVTWMPKLGRFGAERGRFGVLGFVTTFLGVFVSATGTLLAPFIAASTPDRRVHVATMGALMMFSLARSRRSASSASPSAATCR